MVFVLKVIVTLLVTGVVIRDRPSVDEDCLSKIRKQTLLDPNTYETSCVDIKMFMTMKFVFQTP